SALMAQVSANASMLVRVSMKCPHTPTTVGLDAAASNREVNQWLSAIIIETCVHHSHEDHGSTGGPCERRTKGRACDAGTFAGSATRHSAPVTIRPRRR